MWVRLLIFALIVASTNICDARPRRGYSTKYRSVPAGFSNSTAQGVAEIQALNRKGNVPDELVEINISHKPQSLEYTNGAGQGSLTRFERDNSRKKKKRHRPGRNQRKNK